MTLSFRRAGFVPRRSILVACALLLALWTLYWGVQALNGLLTNTQLGRGEMGSSLAFHQVWEVVFVGAYYVIRWSPGAALLGVPLLWGPLSRVAGRFMRRRGAALPA